MKKVLISQKDLQETTSGCPRKVHQEIKLFKTLGYTPYAIAESINIEAVKDSGGVPVKTFKWPISGYFRRKFYANRVKAWAKKNSPDIIIGHGDIIDQDICYIHNCVHLAYKLIHNKDIPKDHQVALIHEEILNQKKFKILVCNSKMMQEDLIKRFNISREKTTVIYPEFDNSKFSLSDSVNKRSVKRDEFGVKNGDVLVGLITSGNFKKRNVDLIIKAADELKKAGITNVKFLIAGKNKETKYQEEVDKRELSDMFLFAPSIKDVELYYYAIDIFVLPAHIEEFGRSVLEAMSLKKPVVVNHMVGSSEIIEGAARDFILPNLELSGFVEKLKLLISNKELRDEIGEINYATSQQYSDSCQNDKLKVLLTENKLI